MINLISLRLTVLLAALCFAVSSVNGQSIELEKKLRKIDDKESIENTGEFSAMEIIKLLTDAPLPEAFNTEEEYSLAKESWVRENAKVYQMATSRIPASTEDRVPDRLIETN